MSASAPFFAVVGGLLAGFVLIAMVGRWLVALDAALRARRVEAPAQRGTVPWNVVAVGVLHSGPWALAIAAFASYFVLSRPHAAWWIWFFGGAGLALAMTVAMALVAAARRRQHEDPQGALTPEVLDQHRRRTLWFGTLFYGLGMSAFMTYFAWDAIATARAVGLVIFIVAICLAGGYLFALFMWQWKKSLLEARESERRRAERGTSHPA